MSIIQLNAAFAGSYLVEGKLGEGGTATVCLARDLKRRRRVALKVLRSDVASEVRTERFLREIELAAGLIHPRILPVLDSGEAGGLLYYVMPFLDGETLRSRLERDGKLPISHVIRIMADVADALAFAHDRGVVHRDIKPDNIMLSGRQALVMDFGVAKAIGEAAGPDGVTVDSDGANAIGEPLGRDGITMVGTIPGTPTYMAPEQAAGRQRLDGRTDLYALGVTAYEMLSGAPPFAGPHARAILARHITDEPASIETRRGKVPLPLAGLVMRLLCKEPADRCQSAGEVLRELDGLSGP